MMDNNNVTPSLPKGEPATDTCDWRIHLRPDSRDRIINKITETLKKHIPCSSPEELRRIAGRFEEKMFSVAVNQTDYLRKIASKILTMETKWQNGAGSSSSLPYPGAYNSLPLNPGISPLWMHVVAKTFIGVDYFRKISFKMQTTNEGH
ncbi:hypothetical protein N665_2183s0006 [Sinapis alba]|nr:hypothetical protein N665_2183s0006 [Sinapis alba]